MTATIAPDIADLTIPRVLARNAEQHADAPALTSLDLPDRPTLTWRELREEVAVFARGLAGLGPRPGERMIIMAPNRPDHLIADLAAVHLGVLPCTAYPTLSADQLRYAARHSAATTLVLHGAQELARWEPVLDDLPAVRRIIVLDDATALPEGDGRFVTARELRARGAELHTREPQVFEKEAERIHPEDPLCLIYTSGTTGNPKGVLLSHHSALAQAAGMRDRHGMAPGMRSISYLPLAHVAERQASLYMALLYAGHIHTLASAAEVARALVEVRPQIFFGVPRVWEKTAAGLKTMLLGLPDDRREALSGAIELIAQGYELRGRGEEVPPGLADAIEKADEAVAPVRALLGLDRLHCCFSGSAPLPVEIMRFFGGLGVEIQEVLGMTETSGVITTNSREAFRPGTVGTPLPGVELAFAPDGELLTRGPLNFLGYLREDGRIDRALDDDGWFPTGDVAAADADGFLTVTDRKKEIIITSGGKNIAPAHIENLLKEHPLIGQAVAIGEGRPYVTALIVLDEEVLPAWAAASGVAGDDPDALAAHPAVRAEIERAVRSANARLARVEQIKRYRIIARTWTPESGEVTPTLKLRRRVVNERHAAEIQALYTADRPASARP